MKRKLFFLLFFMIFTAGLGAHTVHEPNSEIYKDIDIWFVRGYITEFLPLVRPYPVKLIDKILLQVIENGDASAQEKASEYRDALAPGSRFLHPGVMGYFQGNDNDNSFIIAPFAEGLFYARNLFSVSYNTTFYVVSDADGERFNVPGTYSPYPDLVHSGADAGNLQILQNWTNLTAIGNSDIYLQAGLSRSSFGPFYDNGIIIGSQAPRAGHFSFVFWDPLWSYEVLFQTLVATDDFGADRFTSKYSVIHALNYRPVKKIELGFVQSIVYGQRIDPLYFVPFTFLFIAQANHGFQDNVLLGLNFRWRPFNTFLVNTQIYIDDMHFTNLFSGSFQAKAAGEIGVSWAPEKSFLAKLDFDYTAVLPYMYTHWNEPMDNRYVNNKPNYLNYTHKGRNLGPDLQPNSDRFSLRTVWQFLPNLDINASAYFMRHGNASADKDGMENGLHDGSIFDDGFNDNNEVTFWETPPFLTQSVIDMRLGGTICVTWKIPSPFGVFKLMADYGAQYGWNRNLDKGNNGLDHFWSFGGMWSW